MRLELPQGRGCNRIHDKRGVTGDGEKLFQNPKGPSCLRMFTAQSKLDLYNTVPGEALA